MATLCAGTPKIIVRDNRGLDVRTLRYNRGVEGDVAAQYVDAQTHNDRGQPVSSQDPRFFGSATLNFQYTPALSGKVLQTVSADAGTADACTDIAGRPIWLHSQGRGANLQSDADITVQLSYDALGRSLQRACYTLDISGGGALGNLTDIWCYGDYSGQTGATYSPTDTTDARNANQRGQLLQHFDTAGLIDVSALGYAVQSAPLRQDRRFLNVPCDSTPHWKAGPPDVLYDLNKEWLEPDTDPGNLYSTRWTYDALSKVLAQADAKGHQQQTAYDCAGRKYTASVTPKGGTYTPVCAGITYTAAGAIDTRRDANNIQVAYVYEPQTTQRLISLTATRVSTQLQALTYAYDGVGNVITLSDRSASGQVSFFRNRAVTPDRSYTYDALYQLAGATGRENYVNDSPKGIDWPGGGQFSPSSTPDYRPYTRTYTYDLGGNLTTIRSSNWSGAAPPTRQLVVGERSNRAVCTANNAGPTQANIDTYFDPAGKSICLDANRTRPMYWTAFHQLYCVVTAYRTPTDSSADWSASDREQYAYDGDGQRVRKYASSMAGNTWNHADTRYLPGLELRSDTASGEAIEVIVLDDGARVLNWAGGAGKPSDIPNLQLRFQYADRQGSCQIETDKDGNVITQEEYYPYGGTAVLASRGNSEVKYKYIRYSGKERDATGLYYYGMRYYQPWIGRWINPDPAGNVDGQNPYSMVRNDPVTSTDRGGLMADPDPAQGRTQVKALTLPKVPIAPQYLRARPGEAALFWHRRGLITETAEGLVLRIRNDDGSATDLSHPFDLKKGKKPGATDGSRTDVADRKRKTALGFTVMRALGGETPGTGVAKRTAASFAIPLVDVDGGKKRVSVEEILYLVGPLVINPAGGGSQENSFQNIVENAVKNPVATRELARKATLDLVATRITDERGLARGKSGSAASWRWGGEIEKTVTVLKDLLIEKDLSGDGHFYEGQAFLYKYLLEPEKLDELTHRLEDIPKPKGPRKGVSSETRSSRKREAAQNVTDAPPGKIGRSSASTQQADAPVTDVRVANAAPVPDDRSDFAMQVSSTALLPSLGSLTNSHGEAGSAWAAPSYWSDPNLPGTSQRYMQPFDDGSGGYLQPMHGYGDLFYGDGSGVPGPWSTLWDPNDDWSPAMPPPMPAQESMPFAAQSHSQAVAQQESNQSLPDELDQVEPFKAGLVPDWSHYGFH